MEKRTKLDFDLMGKKVRIITVKGNESICIVEEYTEAVNSDRDPIPFVFIREKNNKLGIIYEDEVESIEILEEE